jgi:hypothetical protein
MSGNKVAEMFIGMGRKYNHFEEQGYLDSNNSCSLCLRKHFSYPDTCNDGWPSGNEGWKDRGNHCRNFLRKGASDER